MSQDKVLSVFLMKSVSDTKVGKKDRIQIQKSTEKYLKNINFSSFLHSSELISLGIIQVVRSYLFFKENCLYKDKLLSNPGTNMKGWLRNLTKSLTALHPQEQTISVLVVSNLIKNLSDEKLNLAPADIAKYIITTVYPAQNNNIKILGPEILVA